MISKIGIHPSITDFPPYKLRDALSGVESEIRILEDNLSSLEYCDAVITLEHREELLDSNIQWIHTISAGVDRFPLDKYREKDIIFTNSSGVHSRCMAENVMGFMVMLAHRLHTYHSLKDEHRWEPDLAWKEKFTLNNESICVIGLGAIGGFIAKYASQFNMTVKGVKQSPRPLPYVNDVYSPEEIGEAITDVKFVVLCVPLTNDTKNLLSQNEFEVMDSGSYVVNVSRGPVIDEPALIHALENGLVAGAALDVFQEEPLPKTSPLWDLDNVIITPHISGGFSTYHRNVAELVRENINRLNKDVRVKNRVS